VPVGCWGGARWLGERCSIRVESVRGVEETIVGDVGGWSFLEYDVGVWVVFFGLGVMEFVVYV